MHLCLHIYMHVYMHVFLHLYMYVNVYMYTCAPPARVRLCKGPGRRARIREHARAHR